MRIYEKLTDFLFQLMKMQKDRVKIPSIKYNT